MLREYVPNEKKPFNKLSNFAMISQGIEVNGLTFISTEHAFQAQRFSEQMKKKFTTTGDIGNADSGFIVIFGENNAEKKKNTG